jgi:hypothetical protein
MHPRFGTGMGMNVVLARAKPSRPAIATVFHRYGLAGILASSTAKSSGPEALGVGLGLGDAVALAVGVAVAAEGEVGACA